jgi:hypothetical protein
VNVVPTVLSGANRSHDQPVWAAPSAPDPLSAQCSVTAVVGSVDDAGLQVLDTVAAAGTDPSRPGIGDGSAASRRPVTFTTP